MIEQGFPVRSTTYSMHYAAEPQRMAGRMDVAASSLSSATQA